MIGNNWKTGGMEVITFFTCPKKHFNYLYYYYYYYYLIVLFSTFNL